VAAGVLIDELLGPSDGPVHTYPMARFHAKCHSCNHRVYGFTRRAAYRELHRHRDREHPRRRRG
jgi:hypothetical protein